MPDKIGRVVIVSGPIGAGKTAVSTELAKLLSGPLVSIEGDTFWPHFVNGEGTGRQKQFRAMMRAMCSAAGAYALSGFDVILDFSIPPWFLDTVKKIMGRRNIPTDYVVICPTKAVCAARAASRPEGKIEDYEAYNELYEDFSNWPTGAIKDNGSDSASIAAHVAKGLEAGAYRLAA
jgi:chloramphenicol 3-O-phosphotransferase